MRKNLYREIAEIQTQELELFETEKERILQNLHKEKRAGFRIHPAFKAIGALAACFVLLVTASVYSPVLAENIPFMENIVAFLKQTGLARGSVITDGAVEDYVTPVAEQADANFRVTEVYCDGTALVLGYTADFPDADDSILEIEPTFTFDLDGERLQITEESGTYDTFGGTNAKLYRVEGDTFAGTIALDVSKLDVADQFALTVTPKSLLGVNPKRMVLDQRGLYTAETSALDCTLEPFTFDVTVNAGARSVYTVDESCEDFTLHSIVTSPGFTCIDCTMPDGKVYLYTVEDQDGHALQRIRFENEESGANYYAPIAEDVESLTVTLYDWDDVRTPLATFTVPMTEGGYALHPAASVEIDPEEIVYDPPVSVEKILAPREGESTVALGETIVSQTMRELVPDGSGYVNADATAEITYSNMQVYDSPAEAGIAAEDMVDPTAPLEREGYQFVTFDVDIETKGLYGWRYDDLQSECDAYENNDGTTGILWITSFYYPTKRFVDDSDFPFIDADYFSGHMNGATNYFHFATNAYDTHHFVVGSYVRTEVLESGNLLVGVETGTHTARDPQLLNASDADCTYYEIPAIDVD